MSSKSAFVHRIGDLMNTDQAGDLANSYEIPSYVRFDTSIFYRRENW